jgi:choice-of-anchor B domain-containing protein
MNRFVVLLCWSAFQFSGMAIGQSNCIDGSAAGHPCDNVNLGAKVDLGGAGHPASGGNDIWGWTDSATGKEWAIMGLNSKTAFVDVTDPQNPVHVSDLPTATSNSLWRDVKVYRDHAFIVSEAYNHGMQVFDLTRLRGMQPGSITVTSTDALYSRFGSVHNIVINEQTGFAYAVGSNTCDAGMHVVDIRDPKNPQFATCIDKSIFSDVKGKPIALHGDDYTHDAQCVIYHGPDARYQGKELCFCSNADTVNIVDVEDKTNPVQIAVNVYPGRGYTHQGWLTEDQRYFILGDELDEQYFSHPTKTLVWDMADLENPVVVSTYFSSQKAIDHNMYVKGNYLFQANYDAGMRVLDIADIANGNLTEAAFFDTEPTSDRATFKGAWSLYPYFASGTVILSNLDGYLYVLRPTLNGVN